MEPRINRLAKLAEPIIDEDFYEDLDGDFLSGVMANHVLLQARAEKPEQPSVEIPIIPRSSNENSLNAIGPDNFRGFPQSATVFDANKPGA